MDFTLTTIMYLFMIEFILHIYLYSGI